MAIFFSRPLTLMIISLDIQVFCPQLFRIEMPGWSTSRILRQTSDVNTYRHDGSCVWINLLRSTYGEFLRYYESRFASHEGSFSREGSNSPFAKGAQIRNGMCSTFSKICFQGALEKHPIESFSFVFRFGHSPRTPDSRQTHEKYSEINRLGKTYFQILGRRAPLS
jgi:hypothetical protein